ncbi:hypothetical protein CFOL_v3_34113 [Cephalotus follicularis]|uniref:Uncharacterized protein n=1 Tax=Cephalotus follicularis TaxID=3775 RepID=A0A1Q3DE52_CEPFO|nr:hypothetical protein CFOL_v3_34113 [Cephalotus follicularis]
MEGTEKRKRGVDGEMDGERGKEDEAGRGQTVVTEDDEVEEFFAILGRMQEAIKSFEKGNGEGRQLTTRKGWRPCFKLEDFESTGNGVRDIDRDGDGKEEHGMEEDLGLDLNLNPPLSEPKSRPE